MKSSLSPVLAALALSLPLAAASPQYSNPKAPSCRFGLEWSQKDVLQHTDDFVWDLLYWEGKFHQNDVAYNTQNGMSYDGTQLDWKTGKRTNKHTFSAASKEVSRATVPIMNTFTNGCLGTANYALRPGYFWI